MSVVKFQAVVKASSVYQPVNTKLLSEKVGTAGSVIRLPFWTVWISPYCLPSTIKVTLKPETVGSFSSLQPASSATDSSIATTSTKTKLLLYVFMG